MIVARDKWSQAVHASIVEVKGNTDAETAQGGKDFITTFGYKRVELKTDGKPALVNYDDLYNHVDVRFDLYLDPYYYEEVKRNPNEFEKRFRLTTTWRTSNMVCFNTESKIVRYGCVGEMLEG